MCLTVEKFQQNNKSQPHGQSHLASMANNSKQQMESILRRTDLTFDVWLEDVTSHGTDITPFSNYNDDM